MAALIGLFSAFAVIIIAMFVGGSPAAFVNLAGILIVIVGTIAVTAISFSPAELVAAPRSIWQVLFQQGLSPSDEAVRVIRLAERARKDGVLALEKIIPQISDTPFLSRAVQLIIDGAAVEEVEQILKREASSLTSRHMKSVDVLRRAGDIAPAMGLIGTLIGLVRMLGSLDDPSTIGPQMAVALLTTFYGAVIAHMVLIPLATKAERCSNEEMLLHTVYAMGATSIGRQENPRRLEMLINAILPPSEKVSYFT